MEGQNCFECVRQSKIYEVCASPPQRLAHIIRSFRFGWAPCGFAAIPTAAIDPPHSAASPAVPALIGSGSPSCRLLKFGDLLEFTKQVGMMLGEMTDHPGIAQESGDVSRGQHQIEVIAPIVLLDQLELAVELG